MEGKPRFSLGSKIVYGILVLFILLMFWPESRRVLQQGLYRIGLFQPAVPSSDTSSTDETPGTDVSSEGAAFEDNHGKTVRTEALRGKVVFINFWATWCGPCIAEMPSIQTLTEELADQEDIVFMLVDVDGDLAVSDAFMKKQNLNLPLYIPAGDIPQSWLSGAIPTTVVLDKRGNRVFRHQGMADYSTGEFQEYLRKLAAE